MSKLNKIVDVKFNARSGQVFLLMFLIASIGLFVKFHAQKHLSLDGVNYFFHILENRDFFYVTWSRRFSELLVQWPLVFAVRLGMTNISKLIDIFAIGIYFPYLLSFVLCWYAVRDEDQSLLWFPLAGYIGLNILADYTFIADAHVMALMTWPILLLLLKSRSLLWLEGGLLWLLLILYTRLYETTVLTAGLLVMVTVVRIYRFSETREKVISGISILLFVVGIAIAIISIIDPRSPANRGNFLDSIWVNNRNWEALATCGFIGIFALGWIVSEKWERTRNILFVASLLPIFYYIFCRLSTDYAMTAYISHSSRTLSGVVVPGLVLLSVIVVNTKRTLSRVGILSFVISFLVMAGFNLVDLRYWDEVKNEFLHVINTDRRYVSIQDTPLRDSHYRWSWNNSLLSLVWSRQCVRTIVLNDRDGPQGPIDPRERLVLKRYLKYDSYFKVIDPTISVCNN